MNTIFRATAFSILLCLNSVAQAGHSYVMPVSYDPAGTGIVPGFNGNAELEVLYSCQAAGGTGWVSNATCGASLYGTAVVNLYSTSTTGSTSGTPLGNFYFSNATSGGISGIYFENGQVAGIDGSWGPVNGTGQYATNQFQFQFVSAHQPIVLRSLASDSFQSQSHALPTAYIYMDGNQSNPASLTFGPARCLEGANDPLQCVGGPNAVPEPGTLALSLVALGGLWVSSRRRLNR